jgi:hypothetical protein
MFFEHLGAPTMEEVTNFELRVAEDFVLLFGDQGSSNLQQFVLHGDLEFLLQSESFGFLFGREWLALTSHGVPPTGFLHIPPISQVLNKFSTNFSAAHTRRADRHKGN